MALLFVFSIVLVPIALVLHSLLSKSDKIPKYHEPGRPAVAVALSYAQNPVETIKRATEKCGGVFSLQIFTVRNIFLRGNDLNRKYLDVREDTWSFGGGMGLFLNKILDDGYWAQSRSLIGSLGRWINRAQTLDHISEVTLQEAEKSFDRWVNEGDIKLFERVSAMVHQVIVRCLMGEDFYEKSCAELLDLLHAMEADIGSPLNMILPDWMPHPPARRLRKARERVDKIFHERLQERSQASEAWAESEDYISHTLNDKTTADKKEFLPSHHTLLMFAAHTSTVASISWSIISILKHPGTLLAIQKELQEGPGSVEHTLLQASIRETSRLYAGMNTLRLARRDYELPGTEIHVPAGSVVSISPYLTHHDPQNFEQPESWIPERWISEKGTLVGVDDDNNNNKTEAKFIPFGTGAHHCVGEKMAMMVTTRALETLFSGYDVDWVEGPPSEDVRLLNFARIGSPWLKGDVRVKLTKRK
ncbi:cytochrome P450 [Xylariaceae sp. FL0594]|nr:cytochrome P450 [Xylariaceae sp. FL0594]